MSGSSTALRVGYIIASNEVMLAGKRIGYVCREEPDNEDDSGWRVFSGTESQDYADDSRNFAMYNASTLVEIEPQLASLFPHEFPIAFVRDEDSGCFVEEMEED